MQKQNEVFLIRGKKYKIADSILVREKPMLFSFKKPALVTIGGMQYYHLDRDCYVLYHCKRYPCFDSYDRMHENRYFRAYYFCRSLAEVQEKYDYLTSGKLFFVDLNPAEEYRPPLCPYIYYDEDKDMLNVYEDVKSNSGNKPVERNIFSMCNDFVNGLWNR